MNYEPIIDFIYEPMMHPNNTDRSLLLQTGHFKGKCKIFGHTAELLWSRLKGMIIWS